MSRPKSEATLQREHEREIRHERRLVKQAERDLKRRARLDRRAFRARIAGAPVPKIKPEESRFGLREALAYSGLMDCDKCHRITRERDLIVGVCEFCACFDPEPDLTMRSAGLVVQPSLFEGGRE
jgi:hypothetical protein